jgi:predicted metalloprotease with PDZ domain
MTIAILHRVSIPEPHTHIAHVETTLTAAEDGTSEDLPRSGQHQGELPATLLLFMPVWTPGSYLVREYARHVEGFTVEAPATAVKVRKNAWRVERRGAGTVVVRYRVYANELSVRTSHIDDTHAFLVGAGLFLGVEGQEASPSRVVLDVPAEWHAVTSLEPHVSGGFTAPHLDALVDSPIEVGVHREERFEVLGKPHRYVIWPAPTISDADARRLVEDTKTILEAEAALFGGTLPYDRYDFLLHLSARGRGGLEHRACSALLAPPSSFSSRDGYLDLLSLVAHEAFHAWNVKRIRPAGLAPYRYGEECYTRLLWWFEGATSYYDWRLLARAGISTVEEYLDHVAAEISQLEQTPGRLVHALEETSFDAWIKLYRPDENSLNSTVSYYRKGELVCLLLDLELAARTGGQVTLDRVLAYLWEEHGVRERPVPEDAMQGIFERVAGVPLGDVFDAWVRRPGELDFGAALGRVGLGVERSSARTDAPACSLGVRVRAEGGRAIVAAVSRRSAAWRAGVDPGDEIVGVGGQRIDGTNVEGALRGRTAGESVEVVVAREGRLVTRVATLDAARLDRVKLVALPGALPAARAAFEAWLGRSHPAWDGTSEALPRRGRNQDTV